MCECINFSSDLLQTVGLVDYPDDEDEEEEDEEEEKSPRKRARLSS